jgi:hypothetical protein
MKLNLSALMSAVLMTATLATASCSSLTSEPGVNVVRPDGAGFKTEGLRLKMYQSVESLERDSTAILNVSVIKETVGALSDLAVTDATVKIDSVLKDSTNLKLQSGASITVKQVGTPSSDVGKTLVKVGSKYLLFLNQFELERGKPLDSFVVVGAVSGIYALTEQGAIKVDAEAIDLPDKISDADLRALTK